MHIKRMHEMVEKLTECALCEINKGIENVDTEEMGEVIDMIKDLADAEYHSIIAKEMKEYKEEEEAEEKYMMKRLKEEYKDEYRRMKDEYGEGEETDRRFYDSWRHADGSFARKGTGEYRPRSYYRRGRSSGRRGYEEPMYHITPDMVREHDPEYWRDVDRAEGRLYFTSMSHGGMESGGNSENAQSGDTRSYSEGVNEGMRRGYSEGYERGVNDGRMSGGDSRFERAKKGYEETKKTHKGNTPEDKQLTMREAEKVLNVVFDEIDEMLEDASPEMKNMVKTRGLTRFQKIQ